MLFSTWNTLEHGASVCSEYIKNKKVFQHLISLTFNTFTPWSTEGGGRIEVCVEGFRGIDGGL